MSLTSAGREEEDVMFLYLVQHGDARREEEDPRRPLSEKGCQDVGRMAAHLRRTKLRVDRIVHSGKARAEQTASILSGRIEVSGEISPIDGLSPLDDPWVWSERLRDMTGDVMLVGHLPHLGRLASLLLCGDAGRSVISFRMGGVVCLQRDGDGAWTVLWAIVPEIVA